MDTIDKNGEETVLSEKPKEEFQKLPNPVAEKTEEAACDVHDIFNERFEQISELEQTRLDIMKEYLLQELREQRDSRKRKKVTIIPPQSDSESESEEEKKEEVEEEEEEEEPPPPPPKKVKKSTPAPILKKPSKPPLAKSSKTPVHTRFAYSPEEEEKFVFV